MLRLWSSPPAADDTESLSAFEAVYVDPYQVNGVAVPLAQVVARARRLHAALAGLRQEVVDRVDAGDRTVLVLHQVGRHVGVLPTPLGDLRPTGRELTRPFVEVITHTADRLVSVTVVADDLARLVQADAVRLLQPHA